VKKVAINPNKVSKICNVAIPLAYSAFPDRKYYMCDFWTTLDGNALTKIL
jgi:hypothetical protein